MPTFDRITHDPNAMGGKACIRGMRVTVGQLASGVTIDTLLADFPYLQREDVHQAMCYAATTKSIRQAPPPAN